MTELKAFFRCLAAHVKMEMMYRTHLVVGLVSQLTFSLLSIVFVGVFLPPGSNIQGWGFWEILFLLGLGDATFGLSAILVFRTFLVFDSAYVLQGELDTLLVQPVHPLFNLILRNLQVMEFITLLKGLALAAIAGVQVGLSWTPAHILLFAGMIVLGGAVYCGIFILLFSTGFWFPRQIRCTYERDGTFISRQFQLDQIEVDGPAAGDLFRFDPPAGVEILGDPPP